MQNIHSLGTEGLRWKLNLIDIILLAAALGIDCLIVSFSQGLMLKKDRWKNSLLLAVTMGAFQGFMPVIGYTGADIIKVYISKFAPLFAFAIFFILGIKFITEAFQEKENTVLCLDFKCLISLGVATSIDALIAGASLNFTGSGLVIPSLVIGAASFCMSLAGFQSGNFLKNFSSRNLEIAGGMILILLGIKSILPVF